MYYILLDSAQSDECILVYNAIHITQFVTIIQQ